MTDLIDLLPKLLTASENKQISWSPDEDAAELIFTAQIGSVALVMGTVDRDNKRPYYLLAGRSDQPRESMERVEEDYNPDYARYLPEELAPLWDSARRSAFGLDEVLEELSVLLSKSATPPSF